MVVRVRTLLGAGHALHEVAGRGQQGRLDLGLQVRPAGGGLRRHFFGILRQHHIDALAVMIGLRPYARIRGRQAHYVSLISDKLCTSANVDDVVDAAKRLRWFLRRSDVRVLEQYRAQLD